MELLETLAKYEKAKGSKYLEMYLRLNKNAEGCVKLGDDVMLSFTDIPSAIALMDIEIRKINDKN